MSTQQKTQDSPSIIGTTDTTNLFTIYTRNEVLIVNKSDIRRLEKERQLPKDTIYKVTVMGRVSSNGYFSDKEECSKYYTKFKLYDSNNSEIVYLERNEIAKFERENNLNRNDIMSVIEGRQKSGKGYYLYDTWIKNQTDINTQNIIKNKKQQQVEETFNNISDQMNTINKHLHKYNIKAEYISSNKINLFCYFHKDHKFTSKLNILKSGFIPLCKLCQKEELQKAIGDKFTLINNDNINKLHLKCNSCNETIITKAVSNISCNTCISNDIKNKIKISNETNSTQLELKKYNSMSDILLKCNVCGMQFSTDINVINNKSIRCKSKTCRVNAINKFHSNSLPEYINVTGSQVSDRHMYTLTCSKCNTKFIRSSIRKTYNCPICEPYVSEQEGMVRTILDTSGINYEFNYSSEWITELDFYFPDYNFAVEVNGIAYHSTPNVFNTTSPVARHYKKYQACRERGIQLLQFTDYDIKYRTQIIHSMLLNKLGKTPHKIHARKCIIKEVNNTKAMQFLDDNHLQGRVGAAIKVGLYYEEQLVSYISFTKTSTGYDLNRFANKIFTNIPGSFSKLLKYSIKQFNMTYITSFSDNMYSDGGLYRANGFSIAYDIPIDYKYTKDFAKLLHKSNFMKSKIKANNNLVYVEGLTEKELMEMNGYSRYYDAGKIKWKLLTNN